jgi:hypothetical protein|nr:MAG TPA: hypothetical protein [Caudoviricetes sp.]
MAIDIVWKDRKLVNPRKIKLKNIVTEEVIDYEIQDDLENVIEESDTPINATTLNIMTTSINKQMNSFANFTAEINESLNTFKTTKESELNEWKENYKTEFQNELSNLGSNYLQIIAVEEYEVE